MRRIEVQEYRGQWVREYQVEAGRLKSVFNQSLVSVHHIGSTAVPSLPAKPTVDILCIVQRDTHVPDFYPAMVDLGYEARGECLDATIPGTPGRFYFPKLLKGQHVVHVHVCQQGHPQIRDLIILRDFLRAHPQRAKDYGELKMNLAETVNHDNVAYMRGKDSLVKELIAEAQRWDAEQGGQPDAFGAGYL